MEESAIGRRGRVELCSSKKIPSYAPKVVVYWMHDLCLVSTISTAGFSKKCRVEREKKLKQATVAYYDGRGKPIMKRSRTWCTV